MRNFIFAAVLMTASVAFAQQQVQSNSYVVVYGKPGAAGPSGPAGQVGPRGLTGLTGPVGPAGITPTITIGTVSVGSPSATLSAGANNSYTLNLTLPSGGGSGSGSVVAPTLTVGTVTQGAAAASISGSNGTYTLNLSIPQGAPGVTPAISIGTVTQGAQPGITVSGTSSAPVLNFTIPQGAQGVQGNPGATPNFTVGSVTTGAVGSAATVTISGTASAPVLNFTIPPGATGANGTTPPCSVASGPGVSVTPSCAFTFSTTSVTGGTVALASGSASVTIPSNTAYCLVGDPTGAPVVQNFAPPTLGLSIANSANASDTVNYTCFSGTGSAGNSTPSTPASTTTTLTASSSSPTQGQNVTLTAAVAPSAAPGTVTFKDGSSTLGTGSLSSGSATYSTTALAVGSHSITATYGGNSSYAASTSSATTVTVSAPASGNIAYVKGCSANPCAVSGLSGSLVMLAAINGNNSAATVADSAGGTMPSEVSGWPKAVNGGTYYQHLWAIPNLSGNHSFTISYGSEYYSQTSGSAFSGASTTSPIDATSYNASGYTPQCVAVTPSASTDMLVSVVTGNSTPFNSTNMTNPTDNGAGSEVTLAYTPATGTSAFTPAWNLTGSAGDFGCASIAIH